MGFDVKKKGYDQAQVDEYLARLKEESYRETSELRQRVSELRAEIAEKNRIIEEFEAKKESIAAALIKAVEKADEIEKVANERYRAEMDQLRAFHAKWQAHYDALLKKYPDDAGLRAQSRFNEAIEELLCEDEKGCEFSASYESEKARVSANKTTLAESTASASGFDFNEAWNPTDDLSSIMTELGLMSEED